MCYRWGWFSRRLRRSALGGRVDADRLVPDGGTSGDDSEGESDSEEDAESNADDDAESNADDGKTGTDDHEERGSDDGTDEGSETGPADANPSERTGGETAGPSNVDVVESGEAEPADPKWEPPDLDDIPEFEVRADEPSVQGGETGGEATGAPDSGTESGPSDSPRGGGTTDVDPTAGRPHDAQAPGATAVSSGGTEAYVAALELCARLPDDVRLPEEAADLVPAAVEAELEEEIQSFAAAEFDNPRPFVDTLAFEEVDDDIWLRLRIGLPAEGFEDLDPEQVRSFALERLEGVI